jgi:SagB-type dehydrogenase family enzyme
MVDAREYHERTNHSPRSVREDAFRLDWSNKPRPYKVYEDLPRLSPSSALDPPDTPVLSATAQPRAEPTCGPDVPATDPDVHTLCHYATGVTKELERGGETVRFRAASCTGKLYHVDLYAVTGDPGEFDPGVYHFDPHTGGFDVLREGDYRGVLAAAAGDQEGIATAPVTFVVTSEWWRNAWKYRERTYRHAFWDSGTILANLLAVAHSAGHRASVVAGFADDPVARLLGVDPGEEAPVELVPVGSGAPVPDPPAVDPIDPAEVPLSEDPVDYPLVPDAWRQSTLPDGSSVREWRERGAGGDLATHGPGDGERVELEPVDAETASARPVGATIERRGSLREFGHEPVSERKFATILDRAFRGVPTDLAGDPGLLDCYCLVHAVDGIESGAYQYHPGSNVLERVGETDRETGAGSPAETSSGGSRETAGHLALDQPAVGDAAANVYLTADVDRVVERLGNRGYRLAQLEGGVTLGRLYLATYAHLGLGGRGFTFYDDLVSEHLSPRAANQSPMTMFALGKADR